MERWQVKILALIGCFIVPLICTVLPVKVSSFFEKKGERGKKILSCMMCFGGGVFFATFMLHMAPEARAIMEYSLLEPNNITYPLPDLFMALGFFLVLVCEKIILAANQRKQNKPQEKCVQNSNHLNGNDKSINCTDTPKQTHKHKLADIENLADPSCPLHGSGSCCKDPEEVIIQANATEETGFLGTVGQFHDPHHHEGHLHEEALLRDAHSTRSLILLVALSFHRIFEGMSVGLQHTSSNVISLFIAVMCHEMVIGFSLGLQFVKNRWRVKRILIACFLCSLIMPIGVAVGTLMVEMGNTSNTVEIVNGILQSLATGTFIYVTFFEILQEELCSEDSSLLKVFFVFVGFAAMAVLCAIPEEDPAMLTGHDVDPSMTTPSLLSSTLFDAITTASTT